jgi:hypothetical protein
MTIGAALFLGLLPLAAAPILFHLLMRRQRKTIMFSTELFFDSMKPRLSFHRKFREPLLLAARTLLLLFLLLALARMAFPGMGSLLGLSGDQAVVVVIDNSSSMAGHVAGGDRTKLSVALEGARVLLQNMDQRGRAAVVLLVPDPAAARFGGMTTDKENLLNFLESIRVTDATGDTAKSLLRATKLLKDVASAGGGSMHIFTDFQEAEWTGAALAADDLDAGVSVFLHRLPSAEYDIPNVCPLRAELSARRILPNQPYALQLLLRNDGARDLQVRVNRTDSEHPLMQTLPVTVGAGVQKLVKLPVQPKAAGRHWVRVRIEGDGFDGDNRVFVPYICENKGDIFFLGDKNAVTFGLLPLALSPGGDGRFTSLVPVFLAPTELQGRLQKKPPMLVVMTWATASSLDAPTSALLDQYTQQGGHLMVLPAVDGGKSAGKPPAWIGANFGSLQSVPVSLPLRIAGARSEFWSDLRGLDGRVRLGNAFASKYHPLLFVQDSGYVPLLASGEDHQILALRKHGKGQIVVSGLAFGRTGAWSTLPRQKSFLVMVQPIALGAASGLVNANVSIVAGQPMRLMPGEGNELSITTLLGDQVDWSGLRDKAPLLVRSGAYIVAMGQRESCLTVMPSEREGRSPFIEGDKIEGLAGIKYEISTLSDEDDFRGDLDKSLAGTGLFLPLLLLALACMIAEGLLGSPARKWKDSVAADSDDKPWSVTPAGPDKERS